jgi:hypothetical protein
MINPLELTLRESLLFVDFIAMLLGLFTAWRWEGTCGATVVGGFIAFWSINFSFSQKIWIGWVFPLFLLPALCTCLAGG